ncbi:delta and Notch-like epidermal growth factor-related receptor [Fagus crenata]
MEIFNLKIFTLISFHCLLFTLFSCNLTASSTQLMSNPLPDIVYLINCGQGTYKASNASLLGFECECNPGWTTIQIGPLSFPSCVIPNCTIDFQCGKGTPAPSPPAAPVLPNPNNPCALVWCGDGTCVTNGTGYKCQCNDGSANLLNSQALACFKECYLGGDCNGLELGLIFPHQSSPLPPPPPPLSSSTSSRDGSKEIPNCSRSSHALTTIMLAAIFLTWL